MTFSSFQGSYHYRPWLGLQSEDEPPPSCVLKSNGHGWPMIPRMTSTPTAQRYALDLADRSLFPSSFDGFPNFQDYELNSVQYVGSEKSMSCLTGRYPSPCYSGISSSGYSSNCSDARATPFTSPEVTARACSPDTSHGDGALYSHGGELVLEACAPGQQSSCVTLGDVQGYADAPPETVPIEDESSFCHSAPQEGYQPMLPHDGLFDPARRDSHQSYSFAAAGSNGKAGPIAPVIRKRRVSSRSMTSPYMPSRVSKRPTASKRASSYQGKAPLDETAQCEVATVTRAFPCPFAIYGCPSTFGSKNEWKRHSATQHMRMGFWRCDQCPNTCNKPNDFNRKDLFIQHVRRMHPVHEMTLNKKSKPSGRAMKNEVEDQILAGIAERCYQHLRMPPERSSCMICESEFRGVDSWNSRMEHVGAHMEEAKKNAGVSVDPSQWRADHDLHAYFVRERIVVRKGDTWVLA